MRYLWRSCSKSKPNPLPTDGSWPIQLAPLPLAPGLLGSGPRRERRARHFGARPRAVPRVDLPRSRDPVRGGAGPASSSRTRVRYSAVLRQSAAFVPVAKAGSRCEHACAASNRDLAKGDRSYETPAIIRDIVVIVGQQMFRQAEILLEYQKLLVMSSYLPAASGETLVVATSTKKP